MINKSKKEKLIGEKNPMFGKHHSEESKRKMSLARQNYLSKHNYKLPEETCRKIGLGHKGIPLTKEHISKIIATKKLKYHPRDRWINHYGYVLIYKPDHPSANSRGYVQESRFIMERILKKYLDKKELVHHINGVRDDNRPENLCIVNNHNHEHRTFLKILQKRISELEKENQILSNLKNKNKEINHAY